jgi:hypothetical protein
VYGIELLILTQIPEVTANAFMFIEEGTTLLIPHGQLQNDLQLLLVGLSP